MNIFELTTTSTSVNSDFSSIDLIALAKINFYRKHCQQWSTIGMLTVTYSNLIVNSFLIEIYMVNRFPQFNKR